MRAHAPARLQKKRIQGTGGGGDSWRAGKLCRHLLVLDGIFLKKCLLKKFRFVIVILSSLCVSLERKLQSTGRSTCANFTCYPKLKSS